MALTARLGRGTLVGLGRETTHGTAVTPTAFHRVRRTNLHHKVAKVRRQDLRDTTRRAPTRHYDGMVDAGGDLEWNFGFEGQGLWWESVLGSSSTSGPVSGLYTHTYSVGSTIPSLTIEALQGTDPSANKAVTFEGAKVDYIEWEMSPGGLMVCRAGVMAETGATEATPTTATFTTNDIDAPHHGTGTLSFNSATYTLTSFKARYTNNLSKRDVLGSKLSAEHAPGDIDCEFDVELEYASSALQTAHTAGTTSDAVIIITGSGSRTLTLTIHNAYVEAPDQPIGDVGIIKQKVKFKGQGTSTEGGFKAVVVNTQSSALAA